MTNISVKVFPTENMQTLSQQEVSRLQDVSKKGLYPLFRKCALAALSYDDHDDAGELMQYNKNFDIKLNSSSRGLKLNLSNPPKESLVDGKLIEGARENLFAILRDILYASSEFSQKNSVTELIFKMLRNAKVFIPTKKPNIVVCWGGHSINREEYSYCKQVGYYLGLRKMDICTGCGPGAMKGPMKGAVLGHSKQRLFSTRLIGLTEPSIIASESPNVIVNRLIIMPDIEKRLEAFLRLGHGIIVFPGGVGTFEEIMYLLGILLHPANQKLYFPVIFTGPRKSQDYFNKIDNFMVSIFGAEVRTKYQIIFADPEKVAITMLEGLEKVRQNRIDNSDAFHFNWQLYIDSIFQKPFSPTHKNMANIEISIDLPKVQLAANLRCIMSGIVAGNIKLEEVEMIRQQGPFSLKGDRMIMDKIDDLLMDFIQQQRMILPREQQYQPCYVLNKD